MGGQRTVIVERKRKFRCEDCVHVDKATRRTLEVFIRGTKDLTRGRYVKDKGDKWVWIERKKRKKERKGNSFFFCLSKNFYQRSERNEKRGCLSSRYYYIIQFFISDLKRERFKACSSTEFSEFYQSLFTNLIKQIFHPL